MPQTYKVDEKIPKFKFSEYTLKSIDAVLKSYHDSLTELEKISKNPSSYIDETFGVCNNRYKMRYITPSDVATFVGYIGKIMNDAPFSVENVNDMEIMSVAMIQRFVNDNEKCIPFEDTNAYGMNANFDQRNINLGKLIVMCANEFYDTGVYSKSDMELRAKSMVADVKIMSDMKFDIKMKKLLDVMPKIIEDNIPGVKYDLKTRKLVNETISKFLETICVINLTTVGQMMSYCIPNKSFNVIKEIKNPNKRLDYDYYDESIEISEPELESELIEESVDLTKVKPVFVNLAEASANFCSKNGGDNFVSNTIRKVTGEEYSHSSIGFDVQLNKLYTFNGGFFYDNVYHSQKAGFQFEALRSSKYKGIRVTVYCALVPNDVYDRMLSAATKMEHSNAKYDYKAIVSRWKALNSGDKNANPARTDDQRKQICSSFVNSIMAIAGVPMGEKEIVSPGELGESAIFKPRQFFCVYDGPGDGYDPKLAQEKIEDFAKRPSTKVWGEKAVTECYTECCVLKTNDIRIRSKIPFNCNIRDVVLQDMRPDFKDTESAIMFMLSSERSPITGLLRKYRTIEKVQPNCRILNMFMHLRHSYGGGFDDKSSDPYMLHNEIGRMHTDPNWLDKITYGNQFLDGNYRSDALGNNKFTPMEDTLNHLYSMYCCEGLKTNEELANHIVEVSNVMVGIIHEYKSGSSGCVCNWEMMRDILAALGEILTRTMLKLYDNNSIIFTISDNMDNAAAPGYMYTESFEYVLEADAGPSIKVDTNKTGVAKLLGNIKELIAKFIRWIQDKFMNIKGNFKEKYKAQVEWIQNNSELNGKIAAALDSGFAVNLNNYAKFDVKVDIIKKMKETIERWGNSLDKKPGEEGGIPQTAVDMAKKLGEDTQVQGAGVEAIPQDTNPKNNSTLKGFSEQLVNVVLYGKVKPDIETRAMKKEDFNNMVEEIIDCSKFIDVTVTELGTAQKKVSQQLLAKLNAQNNTTNTSQAATTEENADKPAETNWNDISKAFIDFSNAIITPIVTAIEQKFFLVNYKLYRAIVSAYNNQYDSNKAANPTAEPEKGKGTPEQK